jgi:hypothetical protein
MRNPQKNRIGDRVEVRLHPGPESCAEGTLLERLECGCWRLGPEQTWRNESIVTADQILRVIPTTIERQVGPTTYYSKRRKDGSGAGSLHHREVQALVAVRAGLGRMRLRRVQSPWFCDYYLEPEVDVYGIGIGTLTGLQTNRYIEKPSEEGPLSLTAKGDRILDEILSLEGVSLPPMVKEAVAA